MSIQRFEFRGYTAEELADQTTSGGSLVNFFPNRLDVNLTDDADLTDLTESMAMHGFAFVETSPSFPPNDWRQVLSFSRPGGLYSLATDVFFVLSGGGQGGIGTTGIARDMLPTRDGRVVRLTMRTDLNSRFDVFITINGARTVIAAGVVILGGTIVTTVPTTIPEFTAGDSVTMGVQAVVSAVTVDLTVGVEIEWG